MTSDELGFQLGNEGRTTASRLEADGAHPHPDDGAGREATQVRFAAAEHPGQFKGPLSNLAVHAHEKRVAGYFGGKRGDTAPRLQGNRHERKESERFRSFTYEELTKRDKINLDIFWLKDEALEDSANLPAPEIIAADIVDDLEAALQQFAAIAQDLKK